MKISIAWLQQYFATPLPSGKEIAEAFTFHAFEIEEAEGDLMDVKVLPNRAADCLSHRGLARELSAILSIPMSADPLREKLPVFPLTDKLVIDIDPSGVVRHMGALVRGVKVAPSPEWLRRAVESVGQKSINNIVDLTNYITFGLGQPAHAFDAGKISWEGDTLHISIRKTKGTEHVTVLTGEAYELPEGTLVITEGAMGAPLDVAGIKGGLSSGITEATTDLFISVGNYNGTLIRKTSQALKLSTDASQRFQNRPSPELVPYGMRDLLKHLSEVAGGELVGVVDAYPAPKVNVPVSTTLAAINRHLGSDFTEEEVGRVFKRLDLSVDKQGDAFLITAPFERTDIIIPEDIAEEVGRVLGYDRIPPKDLPLVTEGVDQGRFRGLEQIKDELKAQGYTEISTQSFAREGDIELANPLDKARPALRATLEDNVKDAFVRAEHQAPLVLSGEKPKLFEIGTVFAKAGERVELRMTEAPAGWDKEGLTRILSVEELEERGREYAPQRYALGMFTMFSNYPFMLRDIAAWVPEGVTAGNLEDVIREQGGALLARCTLFDEFKKDARISYAFHLVFQSYEKTLTDDEVNAVMERVTSAFEKNSWEVR